MAKIVYGVSGEGSGHSSRAVVMISYLRDQGHEVRAVSYGKGYDNLSLETTVFKTAGLSITAVENRVSVIRTFMDNLSRIPEGRRKLNELKRNLFEEFQPDCVITDFEPMTAYLANHLDLPLITLDNQHRIRYMKHPCPRRLAGDAMITLAVIRAMVPRPDVSLVTTFYFGEVKNDRTFLFPPILRREVLETRPGAGEHILVYLTKSFDTFLNRLKGFTRERFHVYGTGRSGRDENLHYKPFGKESFLRDLGDARAVMATSGFTLITEALHLRKPYLALPMKGQFEQELNGILLAELGYGKNCRRITDEAVGDFLYRIEEYRERLNGRENTDNREIGEKLDELLADDCALVREFHRRRAGRDGNDE